MRLYLCLALCLAPAALGYLTGNSELFSLERDQRGVKGVTANGDAFCPHPYERVLNECYYASDNELTWQAARHYCRGMEGDLASPSHVYALHAFLRTKGVDDDVFLGASNSGHTTKWLWPDGKLVKNGDWYSGQPDNDSGEHCVVMYIDYDPPLYDDSCTDWRPFVCQYKP